MTKRCLRAFWPRLQWAGWAYVALIWFGSVHLGWHYFSDGVAGIAGALLVWWMAAVIGRSMTRLLQGERLRSVRLWLADPSMGRRVRTRSS